MATANKLSVIPCGAMTADLTWLLLKPGRASPTAEERAAPMGRRARRTASSSRPPRAGCCGTPAARATGRSGGGRPGCRTSSPTTRSPTTSTSTPGSSSWASALERDRLRHPVAPALRPRRQREDVRGHEREAGLPATREGVRLQLRGPVHRRPPQDRLRGPRLRDGLRRHRVPARRHADPDPGPHHRLHVDAGRAARQRHDDLHRRTRSTWATATARPPARRHRQQPRAVVRLGGEAARASRSSTGATMVFGHDADQIHQLRVAPKEFYT